MTFKEAWGPERFWDRQGVEGEEWELGERVMIWWGAGSYVWTISLLAYYNQFPKPFRNRSFISFSLWDQNSYPFPIFYPSPATSPLLSFFSSSNFRKLLSINTKITLTPFASNGPRMKLSKSSKPLYYHPVSEYRKEKLPIPSLNPKATTEKWVAQSCLTLRPHGL